MTGRKIKLKTKTLVVPKTGIPQSIDMTPDEVRRMAEQLEAREDPTSHPLFGKMGADNDEEVPSLVSEADIGPVPPPTSKTYCDSCGRVDSHAAGCPVQRRIEAEQLLRMPAEEADEDPEDLRRASQSDEVIPIARQLVSTMLRKLAKLIDPKGR